MKLKPFDAMKLGHIFFDYRLTPEVKVNIFFKLKGLNPNSPGDDTYFGVAFAGPQRSAAGASLARSRMLWPTTSGTAPTCAARLAAQALSHNRPIPGRGRAYRQLGQHQLSDGRYRRQWTRRDLVDAQFHADRRGAG